jgi:hypothetical protein
MSIHVLNNVCRTFSHFQRFRTQGQSYTTQLVSTPRHVDVAFQHGLVFFWPGPT